MPVARKLVGLARGAAPFVPTNIAGLIGWFDATNMRPAAVQPDSLSNLAAWFKADALSLNDGDPIASWADSSSGGHTLTAAGSARPTYKTAIANGQPVARFDGSANVLTMDTALKAIWSGVAQGEIFAVVSIAAASVIHDILHWTFSGGGMWVELGIDNATARPYLASRRVSTDSFQENLQEQITTAKFYVLTGQLDPSVANGCIRWTDDALGGKFSTGTTGVYATDAGGTCEVGASVGTNFLHGDLAEVIIYQRKLTIRERMGVGHYLSTKYGTDGTPSLDGALVSDWLDQSGQLRDLSQSGSQRPLLKLAIQNGKPVVRFDGTNDAMTSATITTKNEPFTVFTVAKRASAAANGAIFDGKTTNGRILLNNVPQYRILGGTAAGTSDALWHALSMIANASSDQLWVDGASVIGPSAQGTGVLDGYTVGSDATAANWLNGDIAEVLIYDTALGTTDRQSVEAYLKAKWGTP